MEMYWVDVAIQGIMVIQVTTETQEITAIQATMGIQGVLVEMATVVG